jgi:hypothetical protein
MGEEPSLIVGTGGTSPLSLRRRAFFFGVVDGILTGLGDADESGESTLGPTTFRRVGGKGDLGIAFEKGEVDDLAMSLS